MNESPRSYQLTITNKTEFQDDEIYIVLYFQDYSSQSKFWYFEQGAVHKVSSLPVGTDLPNTNLMALESGALILPAELGGQAGIRSARMYLGYGKLIPCKASQNADGKSVVQPPHSDLKQYFDFVEFSLNAPGNPEGNLNIDTTQVDKFGLPIRLNVNWPAEGQVAKHSDHVTGLKSDSGLETLYVGMNVKVGNVLETTITDITWNKSVSPPLATALKTASPWTGNAGQVAIEFNSETGIGGILPRGTSFVTRDTVLNGFAKNYSGNNAFAPLIHESPAGSHGAYYILNPSHWLAKQANKKKYQTALVSESHLKDEAKRGDKTITIPAGGGFPGFTHAMAQPGKPVSVSFEITIDYGGKHPETAKVKAIASNSGNYNAIVTFTLESGLKNSHVQTVPIALKGDITAEQESIAVPDAGTLPGPLPPVPFNICVDDELMAVTHSEYIHGNYTWRVTRGIYPSKPAPHGAGPGNSAPVFLIANAKDPLNEYFNVIIDGFFSSYKSDSLQIHVIAQSNPKYNGIYTGKVLKDSTTGQWVMRFTPPEEAPKATALDVFYPFFSDNAGLWAGYKPALLDCAYPVAAPVYEQPFVKDTSPSLMVFACSGTFADSAVRPLLDENQRSALADLQNQIVSALNRGVALLPAYNKTHPGKDDWGDVGQYYKKGPGNQNTSTWNHYAAFFHNVPPSPAVSINGQAYGFAYDDQTNQSSDIAVAQFMNAEIILEPWKKKP